MNPVQKALWYVETHFRLAVDLDQIARASDASPYYLTRAFATVFDTPLMRYVRQRRLSEAAKQLAAGCEEILAIAVEYGYGSHEAFSRAFKEEFHVTPESIRKQRHVQNLSLREPILMTKSPMLMLQRPRVESLPDKRLAGIVERYDCKSPAGIPDQWQRFLPYLGGISNQVGKDAFGVCYNFDDSGKFDYMTGVEVSARDGLPFGLVEMELPSQKYAVISHGGHITEIRGVIAAIWSDGLAASGLEPSNGPSLERYGRQFDPATGLGCFEIWVAVK